jgi:glutaconate CoA-transferase subunit A
MYVDHVVILPFIAHPMMCHGYYDYDLKHLMMFHKKSQTEEGWQEYLEEFILGVEDHDAYLELIGYDQLKKLKAKEPWGY